MKKIDFEFFAPGQQIYFDVSRIMQVENVLKKGVGEIVMEQSLNMGTLCVLLSIGLRHYGLQNPEKVAKKLQTLLDEGVEIEEIQMPVAKALVASGALGKKVYYQLFPEELTEAKSEALEKEENSKN